MSIILSEIADVGIFISNMWKTFKNMKMTPDKLVSYYEIDLPLMKGGVKYINGVPTQIEENMLILTKPGDMKHATLPHRCHFIHFANEDSDIKPILDRLPNYIYNIDTESYINVYSEISYYFHGNAEKDALLVEMLALKLLHMILEDAERQEKTHAAKNKKYTDMQKYVEFIKNNPAEDLSLEAMALAANFSPIYFHTCFKNYTGKTLHEFVEAERVKKACILLSSTDLSVERVAEACGFNSRSYFSVAFKRKTDLTPGAYRKQQKTIKNTVVSK